MTEPKPFASLSSGLLARKGAARPAMRPQGFGQGGAGLEDLGWNDMGFEAPKAASAPRDGDHDAFGEEIVEHPRSVHPSGLTPVDSPVHDQQAEIADRLGGSIEAADEADEDYDDTAELYQPDDTDTDEFEAEESAEEAPSPEPPPVTLFKKMPVMFAQAPAEALADHVPDEQPALAAPEPAFAAPEPSVVPRRSTKTRSVPGLKNKAAFTLRLDHPRHLKLRLACAVHGRSAQMIVTEALDGLLAAMPELEAMAEKANRKGS